MTAISSARYLAHIYKTRPSDNNRPKLLDAPEQTSIDSVLGDGGDIVISPVYAFFFMLGYPFHTSTQSTLDLTWPKDRNEIVLRTAYFLQLVSIVLILTLYVRMVQKEQTALCLISHQWCCNQCGTKYETKEEIHTHEDAPAHRPTKTHPETLLGVIISLNISLSICFFALALLWDSDRYNCCIISVFAVANILQNVMHLRRIAQTHLESSKYEQPLPSDLVARARSFILPAWTGLLMFLVFGISAFYMTLGVYGFLNIPPVITVLCGIEALVTAINVSQTFRNIARDWRAAAALCPQYGHNWVCVRGCSAELNGEAV
jgi:hypothetical protein